MFGLTAQHGGNYMGSDLDLTNWRDIHKNCCKYTVDMMLCHARAVACGNKRQASYAKKIIASSIREWSDTCLVTISKTALQFKEMGIRFVDNIWGSSCSDNWKKWLKRKLKEVKNGNELSMKQVLFVVAHSCKSGKKKNDKLSLFSDVASECKEYGITLSHDTVDSITIESVNDEVTNFVLSITERVCVGRPFYKEHYVPVSDVRNEIEAAVNSIKRPSNIKLYRKAAFEISRLMICYISVYENSCIEKENNREDPWEEYTKAGIEICNLDTCEPFVKEAALNDYISQHNEVIRTCFQ